MAASDKITEIIDQAAFDQVSRLKSEMADLAAKFVTAFKQADAFNEALKNAGGITAMQENAKKSKVSLDALDKTFRDLSTVRDRLSISENRYTQSLAESRLALNKINQETKDNIKLSLAAEGSMEAMDLQLKSLISQYRALSAESRKALGPELVKQIQVLDKELKALDAGIGRHQRNVGNYASGFNALNNSVAQLSREAPAFAMGINTGFLALSNNIPILFDALKDVRAQNAALQAEGKPTVSVLKQLAGAFFSWNTLISVGVTLLTLYGKEIFEFIKGTDSAEESVRKFSQSLEGMRQVLQNVNDQIEFGNDMIDKESQLLIARAKARGDDEGARKIAIEAEKKGISAKIKLLNDELEKLAGIKRIYEDRKRIKDVNSSALPESKEDISKMLEETYKMESDLLKKRSDLIIDLQIKELNARTGAKVSNNKSVDNPKEVNRIDDLKQEYENRRKVLNTAYNNGEVDYLNYQMKLLEISVEYGKRRILIDESLTEEEKQSKIDLLNSMSKDTKEIFSGLTDAGKAAAKQLKEDAAKNVDEASKNIVKNAEKIEIGFTKANTAIVNLGSTKSFEDLVKNIEKVVNVLAPLFQTLSNIGSEIAGMIADKANFEADQAIKAIDKIEKAELDSLNRLTMGAKQREEEKKKIEIQAEQRRAKAERDRVTALRKAASIQKAADIAGIISGTALAIVNALKTQPAPLGIALAAGVGVTGAIQLARAIQTPLPQYGDGTDNAEPNFIAGERGIEMISTPDGKSFLTPDDATIYTNMPKGTKVKSNEDLLQDVYNTALIKLSAQGAVTHSKMDEALLEAFKENNSKLDNLTSVVKDLELSATFQNFSDHISHVKSRVR